MWARNILLGIAVSLSFLLGYTTVTHAWPGVANRAEHQGYFRGQFDDSGFAVWHNGIPSTVAVQGSPNAANSFIGFVNAKLNDNQANTAERLRNRIGAVFIVKTMLGIPGGTGAYVTPAEWNEWRARVLYAASRNAVRWNVVHAYSVNSFYQGNPPLDDAFYYESGASSAIVFTSGPNASGSVLYAIRRECANPVGNLAALPRVPVPVNYNLDPNIGVAINGAPTTINTAEPGDQLRFTYTVTNTGSTASPSVGCNTRANNFPGYFVERDPPPNTGPPGPATGCPRAFPANSGTTVAVENITIAANGGNQTICRSLFVNPASSAAPGERGTEVCIVIANKPYVKAFNGDIMAGSGLETAPDTCINNANGSIVTWNKQDPTYHGAGTQFAAYAMDVINDFATAQAVTGAVAPSGLAFSNQGADPVNGQFGGTFGSVSCIPDYFAAKPATTNPLAPVVNVSPLGSGAYSANVPTTITGGNVSPGERMSLFIDGDVVISGNITYSGNWSVAQMPLFHLVVRGNIYITPNVTQIDGVLIAQKRTNNTAGGLYTCTNPALPFTPLTLSNTLFNLCNSPLTINGSVVANSISLLRTRGSLAQSNAGENRTNSTAAEIFNYSPSAWIAQPRLTPTGGTQTYDSITSLPPVL